VATLPIEIVGKGTMAEAGWAALGKNHNHGVRRTREDKRKAVQMALGNEAAAKMSNRKLAEYIEVSHTFVANERKVWDLCGNVAVPEVRWFRSLLDFQPLEKWKERCDWDVATFERDNPWTSDNDEGFYTHNAANQWMRMTFVFNEARFKIELRDGRPSWQYPLNETHVACIMARACGYDPGPGMWDLIRRGWSLDYDLPVDDIALYGGIKSEETRKIYQDVDLFEWGLYAPHRHVVFRSDYEVEHPPGEGYREWGENYPGRTWPDERELIAYSIKHCDGLSYVMLDGDHLEPGHETKASAHEWIDWHSTARGQRNYVPIREIEVQP
jgi:hypothetical protein